MKHILTDHIRDGGYEVLSFLAGTLALTVNPTPRNAEQIAAWFHETRGRQQNLQRLRKRGLVEANPGKAEGVLRLTEMGRAALDGGRQPEAAWSREWDGDWRLLLFDLPRDAGAPRVKFWRWLCANHFGRLQGSAWITPHPVPDIHAVVSEAGLDPSTLMVFTGAPKAGQGPQSIAAEAWDFASINAGYREYTGFAERILRHVAKQAPAPARLKEIARQDRKQWWTAVRRDPLLPKDLLPKGYEGAKAWKQRLKLHKALARPLNLDPLP